MQMFHPYKVVSVDEMMVPFKGRHFLRVRLRGKPKDTGFKVFALCDTVSGYTSFSLYSMATRQSFELCLMSDTLARLSHVWWQNCRILSSLYTWITGLCRLISPGIFWIKGVLGSAPTFPEFLSHHSRHHITGTLKSNKKWIPKELKDHKKRCRNHEERVLAEYCAGGWAYTTLWIDKKACYLLSSMNTFGETVEVGRSISCGALLIFVALDRAEHPTEKRERWQTRSSSKSQETRPTTSRSSVQ